MNAQLPSADKMSLQLASWGLLRDPRPSFFFASSLGTHYVPGHRPGQAIVLPAAVPERLLQVVAEHQARGAWVVGALPFDSEQPSALQSVSEIHVGAPWLPVTAAARPASCRVSSGYASVENEQQGRAFVSAVATSIDAIERGILQKVVLARHAVVPCDIELPILLSQLRASHPQGYTYALAHGRATWVGASPELLIRKQGRRISCLPLAGSRPKLEDQVADEAQQGELRAAEKDQREHRWVVEHIARVLAPLCESLHVDSEPRLVETPSMWHLGSQIHGTLRSEQTNALGLALALHPTPAVGGVPQHAAQQWIAAHENFDRELFGGCVGYMDPSGDGQWAVTIRCAAVQRGEARLYAGAGIVSGSEPELELQETAAKMRTMQSLLVGPSTPQAV